MKFNELGLSAPLLKSINALGFDEPTEIQEESIPYILEGRDVLGESSTGSGKTLAFGCGVIEQVVPRMGLQALILTPTRELAEQIKDSLKEISRDKKINVLTIYGGVAIDPQIRNLHKADVVVATPGRLLDHMDRRTINLSKVKFLVLDEADRMLDMGFINDVEDIIRCCPQKRQTLFFSATLVEKIQELAHRYMDNPVKVSCARHVDPTKLEQVFYDVDKNKKFSLLCHLLKKEKSGLSMVFCNTRRTTEFLINNLRAQKINVLGIHGGLSQNKRTKVIKSFNKVDRAVLVCTDVVARGLHVDNVSHVYNYEIPKDHRDYVHRIGRTARAGEEGKVINILCHFDYDNFARVQHEYRDFVVDKVEVPELQRVNIVRVENSRRGFQRGQGFRGRPTNRGHGRGASQFRGRRFR